MANINLVPEVKKEQAKLKKLNLVMTVVTLVVGGILMAAILIFGALYTYRKASISSLDGKISTKNDELKAYAELENSVVTLENGLADIKTITSGGRDWTAFFSEIEKATPADIQFKDFKISGDAITATLDGKDVKSIDRFIKSFSTYKGQDGQLMFPTVAVDGYTVNDDGGVTFSANLTVAGE